MINLVQLHALAVRISEVINPRALVETNRVDHEVIAIPFSDGGVAQPLWIGILRKLPSICPDFTQHAAPLKELQNAIRKLNELERPAEKQNSRIAQWIAISRRIVSLGRRYGARSIRGYMCVELLLAPGGHRRR